jgi:hypothetical protein
MVPEIAKQRYKNQNDAEFKHFHWWEAVRYQSQWRVRSDAPSKVDAFVSLSEARTEEEVTHFIGRDRAKMVARKGKGKEDSNNQSEFSSAITDIMYNLKKLGTSFTRTQM